MCLVSGEGPHRVWGRLGVISLVMRSLSCDGGCCHLGIRETAPSLLLLSASTRARVPEESGPFLLPHPPWLSGIMHQLSLHSLQIGCGPNRLILQSKEQGEMREMSCSLKKKLTSFPCAPKAQAHRSPLSSTCLAWSHL